MGSWNMANGNTGYYPISYGPYSPRQTYYPNTRTSGFAPQVSSASDPDPVRPIVYRPPSRTENYRPNPNPGYTFPNSNNRYQTRGSTHENYTPQDTITVPVVERPIMEVAIHPLHVPQFQV
ncbi:hypothetical protein KFE98_11675 [bacterium SCSIO 12741]|nr:hypothetical protein KFE98_11675 [bacterium SCSIO 12741]